MTSNNNNININRNQNNYNHSNSIQNIQNETSYRSIVKLAKSLNISASGSKEEIKKRILLNNNRIECNNINNELIVNNNNNNEINYDELLFWKIIKNKYLFNLIISNLKRSLISPKYENYVDLLDMAADGKIGLIKYKLMKNHHLDITFSTKIHNKEMNSRGFDYTFGKVFKVEYEDTEFYNLLFKRFSNHINGNLEENILRAIKYDNLLVLELLTKEPFNYKFSKSSLKSSIYNNSSKSFQLIFDSIGVNRYGDAIEGVGEIGFFNGDSYGNSSEMDIFSTIWKLLEAKLNLVFNSIDQNFRYVNILRNRIEKNTSGELYRYEKLILNISDSNQLKSLLKIYKIIIILIKEYYNGSSNNRKPPIPKSLVKLLFNSFFSLCPFYLNFKLKHLLKSCYLITLILELYNSSISSGSGYFKFIQDEEFKSEIQNECNRCKFGQEYNILYSQEELNSSVKKIYKKFILSRQELDSISFTKEELNSNIQCFNNGTSSIDSERHSSIRKLVEMYLSINTKQLFNNPRYLLLYNNEGFNKYLLLPSAVTKESQESNINFELLNYCIIFGCARLFERLKEESLLYWNLRLESFNELNSVLTTPKRILFKYSTIDRTDQIKFIQDISSIIKSKGLFELIIAHDDLEFIKVIEHQEEILNSIELGLFIRSASVLKVLYKLLNENHFNSRNWLITENTETIKEYLNLVSSNSKEEFKKVLYKESFKNPSFIKTILSSSTFGALYYYNFTNDQVQINSSLDLSNIKYSIINQNFHFTINKKPKFFFNSYEYQLLEWLSNNLHYIKGYGNDSSLSIKYNIGLYDGVIKSTDTLIQWENLVEKIVYRNDMAMVMKIMQQNFKSKKIINQSQNQDSKLFLYELLFQIVKFNRLQLLKEVYTKYQFIFFSYSILDLEGLRRLIYISIINQHIEMFSFFINPNSNNNAIDNNNSSVKNNKPISSLLRIEFLSKVSKDGKQTLIYNLFKDKVVQDDQYNNHNNNNNNNSFTNKSNRKRIKRFNYGFDSE